MTVENLYRRVQSCSNVKHSGHIGLLGQAEVICNYICDMVALRNPNQKTDDLRPNAPQAALAAG